MARPRATAAQFQIVMQTTIEATQRILVETAKREHAKIMASDPRPGGFHRYVDGILGAAEEVVRSFGVIQYDYQRLDLVVQFAMETLFDRSPVLSGAYRTAHTIFLDGIAVDNLKDWRPGQTIVITNIQPYARKIELGRMRMRVPGTSEVYQQAERVVRRRFGNVAKVRYTFQGVIGSQIASRRAGNKSDIRFPALVISE